MSKNNGIKIYIDFKIRNSTAGVVTVTRCAYFGNGHHPSGTISNFEAYISFNPIILTHMSYFMGKSKFTMKTN